jgi:predicted nucleotidyltransferase
MAKSGKKVVETGPTVKDKIYAARKMPVSATLTDGYQILEEMSINNKIPFEELLGIITDSILESVGRNHLKSIYMFGSHVYGKPNQYSDIDLCVVISNRINKSKAYFNIAKELNNKKIVSLDILIYNEKEYDERKGRAGIVNTIYTRGRMLYG